MRTRSALVLSSSLLFAACGRDSTNPADPPASIVFVVPPPTSVVAGQALTTAPTFAVKSQQGRTVPNVPVTVTVTGGGTVTSSPAKTSANATSIGTWTLGTAAGANTVTITATGVTTPLTATVTGTPGPLAAITILDGDGQSAPGGTALPTPVHLAAVDQYGNAIPDQTMTFAVSAGGGTLSASSATATSTGAITAPAWTLGKSVVPQQLLATAGSAVKPVTATVASGYNIVVRFWGTPMTAQQQALFTTAAARLSAVITGDLPDVAAFGRNVDDYCGTTGVGLLNEIIDDVLIYASVQPIDGPGQIVAQAGPCAAVNGYPVLGVMEFDSDDLGSLSGPVLQDVITHEMLHVLGFGTLWRDFPGRINLLFGVDSTDFTYVGSQGILGCQAVGGAATCASNVPVENHGGEGTVGSHWRETIFDTELMTGYLNFSTMPLSRITIGSLADLGYTVNFNAADPYTIPGAGLRASNRIPSTARLIKEKLMPKPRELR